jgi:curved DNA-binding protein CbpA
MTFIRDVLSPEDLKKRYRSLAMHFHPDKGGCVDIMQQINTEYSIWQEGFSKQPRFLEEIQVGNTIFVNGSRCIVTEVTEKLFKAKSLVTSRESYFDKETGYAQFNLKIRAYINYDILENVN